MLGARRIFISEVAATDYRRIDIYITYYNLHHDI